MKKDEPKRHDARQSHPFCIRILPKLLGLHRFQNDIHTPFISFIHLKITWKWVNGIATLKDRS